MGQPVKVSDQLVVDARLMGSAVDRSIAGQIEFWARLGRALEPLLSGDKVLALCRAQAAQPLSACLRSVDTPAGRQRVVDYLKSQPFPHYEPARHAPGYLVRTDAQGARTVGRFVQRKFRPMKPGKR